MTHRRRGKGGEGVVTGVAERRRRRDMTSSSRLGYPRLTRHTSVATHATGMSTDNYPSMIEGTRRPRRVVLRNTT